MLLWYYTSGAKVVIFSTELMEVPTGSEIQHRCHITAFPLDNACQTLSLSWSSGLLLYLKLMISKHNLQGLWLINAHGFHGTSMTSGISATVTLCQRLVDTQLEFCNHSYKQSMRTVMGQYLQFRNEQRLFIYIAWESAGFLRYRQSQFHGATEHSLLFALHHKSSWEFLNWWQYKQCSKHVVY
ncbi:unnamed protein product [Urochloa humidicola]